MSIAPTRLAMIYVDDPDQGAQEIEITPTDTGADVWHLRPYDNVVFERTLRRALGSEQESLRAAGFGLAVKPGFWCLSNVQIDLLVPSSVGGLGRRGALLGHR